MPVRHLHHRYAGRQSRFAGVGVMPKYRPQDGTRFQRLLALTMSGGEKARKNKRVRAVADTISAIAFVILILFIWVALP
jgi:hypothetical protein|tara:strand:+ start:457 stop:693 length:237 start_codon:yes stop_codon:yes gene_type:complete